MSGEDHSLLELRQDLQETESVIEILERASEELTAILHWDDPYGRTRCVGDS